MSSREKNIFAAVIAIIFILAFAAYELFSFSGRSGLIPKENMFFVSESASYPSFVEISNSSSEVPSIGFAPGASGINFGIVPSGGNYATKFIDVSNNGESGVLFSLVAEGDIAKMVEFGKNNFLLGPKSSSKLSVKLLTGKDTPVGNYSGKITLSKIKAKNFFADRLLAFI